MRIHINLSDDLIRDIDAIAGKGNRSEYIANAVYADVRRDRLLKAIREGAGMLDPDKYPYWSTPEKVNEWISDLRDTPSLRGDPIDRIPVGHQRLSRVAERPTEGYDASGKSHGRPRRPRG